MFLVQSVSTLEIVAFLRFNTLYVLGSTSDLLAALNADVSFNTLYVLGSSELLDLYHLGIEGFNTLYVLGSTFNCLA